MSDLREGFEAWLSSKFICTDGGLNEWTKQFEYAYPHVQSMWVAWQASRQHDGHAEFVRVYNSGYAAGHHDTVEGQYTHILPVDMDTYHAGVVGELLAELAKDQP